MTPNNGVIVSTAINAFTQSDSATLYTCPANSYAIIQVSLRASTVSLYAQAHITIGGATFFAWSGTVYSGSSSPSASSQTGSVNVPTGAFNTNPTDYFGVGMVSSGPIYVGPGQAVQSRMVTDGAARLTITGVEFKNILS